MKAMLIFAVFCILIISEWNQMIKLEKTRKEYYSYYSRAVAGIVGEAANQGAKCMGYVAHAIRNRGTLKGVYGVNAQHNATEPIWVWENATKAWEKSKNEVDPTNGAVGFGTKDEVPGGAVLMATCKDLYFYKNETE